MKTVADCPTCGPYIAQPSHVHSCSDWRTEPVTVGDVIAVGRLLLALLLGIALVSVPWLVTR